ncbi:MAG: DUF1329 domain-containing protein [Pseudomonadota bacterium]
MKQWKTIALAAMAMIAVPASATPTAAEAAQLGKELTPVGAERAGNKDGSIPEWTGGLCKPPANYKPVNGKGGWPYVNSFDNEKPLFSITAANMAQYEGKINEAQKVLLSTYPKSYRIDVYKTHRTACYPELVYENTIKRVMTPKLVGAAPGLEGAHAQIPFPIPKTGQEVIWNSLAEFLPVYFGGEFETYLADSQGNRTLVTKAKLRYRTDYWNNKLTTSDMLSTLLNVNEGPAAKAGSMDMRTVWKLMNQTDPRAWSYTPGQRRVRVAPEFTYDTVSSQYAGLQLFDEINGFDGKMDRFDFKLTGKKEMYIPANTTKLGAVPIDVAMLKNHVNPDVVRWELRRVWVVEATRKPEARHIYSKKVFYVDEDSWHIAAYEAYDQAGKLYRHQSWMDYQAYDIPAPIHKICVGYDFNKNAYFVGSRPLPGTAGWRPIDPLPETYFTPDSMAGMGVR